MHAEIGKPATENREFVCNVRRTKMLDGIQSKVGANKKRPRTEDRDRAQLARVVLRTWLRKSGRGRGPLNRYPWRRSGTEINLSMSRGFWARSFKQLGSEYVEELVEMGEEGAGEG